MDILPLELQKLGLKEKEVKVYLAGLLVGPSSVQEIAKKAEVTRPTTYSIIRELKKKGLFGEVIKGKKRYFVAQSPEKILGILRLQKRELEEKEREFIRIIATLEAKYGSQDGGIQTFRGQEGIEMLKEQLLFTASSDLFVFTSENSSADKKRRKEIYRKIKTRLGKLNVQEKSVPKLGGTLFLSDKAIFVSAKKQEGYLIDNLLVVGLLKSLF